MSANHISHDELIDGIAGRAVPQNVRNGAIAAMLAGVVGFGGLMATGATAWAWGAVLVGVVYTLALAQGGIMYLSLIHI